MSLKKLGRYDLIRVLGKGAMGLVYEGRDPNLDRRVAIKTIKVENLSEEAATEYEARFRTEARSAARLQHPNIVSVYDSDRDLDIAYLVMEFIQGEDLKHHLDMGTRYTLEQTLGIMGDLLSALEYAHQQNIVHRDIKPANLLIEKNGRIKLTDFGVARIQDSGDATRTQGTMVGTLKYMAPEQVQGLPVDARADLFAAGIVLYQLLTARRPFDGDSDFVIIQQIVTHAPPAPSSFNDKLPTALDSVMTRALAKSRDLRFQSAPEFAAALQAAAREAEDRTVVPPPGAPKPGASATWSATVRAGEGLIGLQTNSGTDFGGTSTVTQELELVYWKDIKDSDDVEDLAGFLSRFPSGIYADLARRRLRKLGVNLPANGGEDTDRGSRTGTGLGTEAGTLLMPRSDTSNDKTLVLTPAEKPRYGDATATGVGAAALAASLANAATASAAAPSPAPASSAPLVDRTPQPAAGSTDQDRVRAALEGSAAASVAIPMPTFSAAAPPLAAPAPPPAPVVNPPVAERPAVAAPIAAANKPVVSVATPAPVTPSAAKAAKPVHPAVVPTTPVSSTKPSEKSPADATGPSSKRGLWAVAALVLLAVAGGGYKLLSGGSAGDDAAAVQAAASAASAPVAAASQPVVTASAPLPVTVVAAASAPVSVTATPPADTASAPSAAASAAAAVKAAAAAKRLADRQARAAQLKAGESTSGNNRGNPSASAATKDAASRQVTETAAAAAPTASGNPRSACENRILLGFQMCMTDQCAKPQFTHHPVCVERRAMEQRRNEAIQNR